MALVLGINMGVTRYGKKLKDGGACLIEDGQVRVAIAEERLSRIKHSGGFKRSYKYCLDSVGCYLSELDLVVLSSTCEELLPDGFNPGINFSDQSKFKTISHHLSHAYSAYMVSPFDEALIVVMDAGGNVVGRQFHREWWKNHREQQTYYIGRGDSIKQIGSDFMYPLEMGFGEAYRCFTHYLGWHSYVYSGKTMGLAAYGDPERFDDIEIFDLDSDGRLTCKLVNNATPPAIHRLVIPVILHR